jgi:hypothetical protein
MQTSQKPWQRDRKGQQKQIRVGGSQSIPSLLRGIRPFSAPGLLHRPPPRGGPPFQGFNQRFPIQREDVFLRERLRAVSDNFFRIRSDNASKSKILVNPHFQGATAFNPQMAEAGAGRPPQQLPSLMSLNVSPRHPHQQFAVCMLQCQIIP